MSELLDKKHVIMNAILFQLCWFSAILIEWYIALIPLIVMIVHIISLRHNTRLSIKPLILLSMMGIVMDSILKYVGVYDFSDTTALLPFLDLPLWLAVLWFNFCFTLSISLEWLLRKPLVFTLACMLMGPVSYLAGRRFEVVAFSDSNLWILSLEWLIFALISLFVLLPKLGVANVPPFFLKKGSAC